MGNCSFRGLFWYLALLRLFDARFVYLVCLIDSSVIGSDWAGVDWAGVLRCFSSYETYSFTPHWFNFIGMR